MYITYIRRCHSIYLFDLSILSISLCLCLSLSLHTYIYALLLAGIRLHVRGGLVLIFVVYASASIGS